MLGIGLVVLILNSPQTHAEGTFALRGVYATFLLLIGWGFAGTGLYAWSRRPGNAIGPLMTAAGLAWLLRGLEVSDNNSVLFSIGELAAALAYALLAHLLLAFPSGHLSTPAQRQPGSAGLRQRHCSSGCGVCLHRYQGRRRRLRWLPPNPILIFGSNTLAGLAIFLQLSARLSS